MVNKKKWYAQSQKQKLLNWMKHDSDIILLNRTNNNRKLNTANTIKVRTLIHSRSEKAPKSSVNCMIYGPVKSKPVLHYPVNWNQSVVQLIEICRLLRAIHNVRTLKVTYLIDLLVHILTKEVTKKTDVLFCLDPSPFLAPSLCTYFMHGPIHFSANWLYLPDIFWFPSMPNRID